MAKIPIRYLFAAILILAGSTSAADVAVLVEEGFPQQCGFGGIVPAQIARLLKQHSIEAEAITVADITGGKLTPNKYPVFVMLTGSAFPQSAYPMIRAYHKKGGCLVLNGTPFCKPHAKEGKEWKSPGNKKHNQHNEKGIGTGDVKGVPEGSLRAEHYGFGENILGLGDDLPLPKKTRLWSFQRQVRG